MIVKFHIPSASCYAAAARLKNFGRVSPSQVMRIPNFAFVEILLSVRALTRCLRTLGCLWEKDQKKAVSPGRISPVKQHAKIH